MEYNKIVFVLFLYFCTRLISLKLGTCFIHIHIYHSVYSTTIFKLLSKYFLKNKFNSSFYLNNRKHYPLNYKMILCKITILILSRENELNIICKHLRLIL